MSKKVRMYYGGTATKHVCGTKPMEVVALHPGVHEYKVSDLETVKSHPDMMKLMKEGTLCTEEDYLAKLGKKPAAKKEAPKVEDQKPVMDEAQGGEPAEADVDSLLSGNVRDTVEMVQAQDDKEVLEKLLAAEKDGKKRKGVMDAIEEKLK